MLAPGACGWTVRLWNPAVGRPVGAPVPTGSVFGAGGVAFSPNGKPLASPCGDATVRLWNPVTGHRGHLLESPQAYHHEPSDNQGDPEQLPSP